MINPNWKIERAGRLFFTLIRECWSQIPQVVAITTTCLRCTKMEWMWIEEMERNHISRVVQSKSFQLKKTAFGAELLLPYLQLLFILFCYPSHRKLRFFFISFCFRLLSIKTRLERVIYHNINCLSFFSFNSSFFTGFSSWTWVSRYKWVGSCV